MAIGRLRRPIIPEKNFIFADAESLEVSLRRSFPCQVSANLTRNTRAPHFTPHPTSSRSTGFCAIWGCISSSSQTFGAQHHRHRRYHHYRNRHHRHHHHQPSGRRRRAATAAAASTAATVQVHRRGKTRSLPLPVTTKSSRPASLPTSLTPAAPRHHRPLGTIGVFHPAPFGIVGILDAFDHASALSSGSGESPRHLCTALPASAVLLLRPPLPALPRLCPPLRRCGGVFGCGGGGGNAAAQTSGLGGSGSSGSRGRRANGQRERGGCDDDDGRSGGRWTGRRGSGSSGSSGRLVQEGYGEVAMSSLP